MAEPIYKIRKGNVSIAVWENKTEKGTFYSFQIQRSYKDRDGNWKNITTFGINDLPKLAAACNEAFNWNYDHTNSKSEEEVLDML